MPTIRLGLIGDNIAQSKSPLLHRLAGTLCGLDVSYEPLVPAQLGLGLEQILDRCRREGFAGVNVTYPYKERVVAGLDALDEGIAAIGAVNTVRFEPRRSIGFNTDYTGFIAAFRHAFPERPPGRVALIGAGGVGKAIAFGLLRLGAAEIRIFDTDRARSDPLVATLRHHVVKTTIVPAASAAEAADGADGIINATPLGMVGLPGSPVDASAFGGRQWAFDAVYTPPETAFIGAARSAGVAVMSGYELFFYQGLHAFSAFTGAVPDAERLRAELRKHAT